jgi:hypothetical protein
MFMNTRQTRQLLRDVDTLLVKVNTIIERQTQMAKSIADDTAALLAVATQLGNVGTEVSALLLEVTQLQSAAAASGTAVDAGLQSAIDSVVTQSQAVSDALATPVATVAASPAVAAQNVPGATGGPVPFPATPVASVPPSP